MTVDQILYDVHSMLTEIIGSEYALSLDIDMQSSFEDDLELESIEFVTLATKLTEHYGDRVELAAFLVDKKINQISKMTVGDVVNYIAACLIPAGAGALDG